MIEQMVHFFASAFVLPGLGWKLILVAIALGIAFGAVWLVLYRPPLFARRGLWAVLAVSAFLTWTAIAFVQIPLQQWTGQALQHFWDTATLTKWLLLAGIPQILLSGIVQEAAKLVPVVVYWWRDHWDFTPKFGLMVGAVSGAGFGVFEAVWVHNTILASGWSLATVDTYGLAALTGFVERFFAVGFHIAVSALAGYGLAKHMGWQFYVLAAALHGAANYSVVLLQSGLLTSGQVETYVAVFAIALTVVVLRIRRHQADTTVAVAPTA
jgi:RsiW-degrading membrane proteinase PrsW (M82 family)